MPKHNVIVVGASAGGVEALKELVHTLPADIPAAIFIVLHLAADGTSLLQQILSGASKLPVLTPLAEQAIQHGHIYVAPPDHHLLVKDGYVLLIKGPRENGFRPSIDALFRSAANVYGSHVIGVLLTGMLDDGSAGLVAIQANGGYVIVQDPADAIFPGMPTSALQVVQPDYVLRLAQIPETLLVLAKKLSGVPQSDSTAAIDTAETAEAGYIYNDNRGKISDITCPDCGGVLVEYHHGKNGNLIRFECRVGHRYSLQSLAAHQSDAAEIALWAAVRALEEKSSIARRMVGYALDINDATTVQTFENKRREAEQHADIIRQLLLDKTANNN